MHGNVWEWVEEIYHDSYKGAPTDGTAWISRQPRRFLVQLSVEPPSAVRGWNGYRTNYLGFRVAGHLIKTLIFIALPLGSRSLG